MSFRDWLDELETAILNSQLIANIVCRIRLSHFFEIRIAFFEQIYKT